MSSLSRQQLISFLNKVDITDKDVLDAGSGPKEYHAKKWVRGTPKHYDTLDIDKNFNPTHLLDLNKSGMALYNQYDVVFCLETLEHIWNPVRAAENLQSCTRPDGTIYISTPLINPIHDKWDYLRFTDEWFIKVFSDCKEVKITPRIATAGLSDLIQFYNHEGLRMSKIRIKAGEGSKIEHIGYFVKVVK